MDERLTELESCVAFQDDTIKQLSDVIARQQRQIDALQAQVQELKQQLTVLAPSLVGNPGEEPPPPHY